MCFSFLLLYAIQQTFYCLDIGGFLVIPNTSEKHDFILYNMERGLLWSASDAVWMGLSNLTGVWIYENNLPVLPANQTTGFALFMILSRYLQINYCN